MEEQFARWHAVRVTPGRERAIARQLERRGVALYLPLTDRVVIMQTAKGVRARVMQWAMFSGLIFVYSLRLHWGDVVNVPGVRNIVYEAGRPAIIPTRFIRAMLWLELHDSDTDYVIAASKLGAIELANKEAEERQQRAPGRRGRRGWRERNKRRRRR